MRRMAIPLLAAVLPAALAAGGCGGIRMTFVNHTDEAVELELDGPIRGDDDIGAVAPGGSFAYDLHVPKDELPATLELEAGRHEVKFTVNEHTPRRLRVDIYDDRLHGPR